MFDDYDRLMMEINEIFEDDEIVSNCLKNLKRVLVKYRICLKIVQLKEKIFVKLCSSFSREEEN